MSIGTSFRRLGAYAKLLSILLAVTLVLGGFPPVRALAAASVSLSPSSTSLGYSTAINVTATGTGTDWVSNGTNVTLLSGDTPINVVSGVTVDANAQTVGFSIATGLGQGTYTVRISSADGAVETPFTVTGSPSVTLSQSSISLNYSSAVSLTATGTNTHFVSGQTTVSLRDGSGTAAGTVSSVSVNENAQTVSFNIATGLAKGTYTVRIVTGGETVSTTFTVKDAASITSLSPSATSLGYSAFTMAAIGTNTTFISGQTTVSLLSGTTTVGTVSGVTVADQTHVSFTVGAGLGAGDYTVRFVSGAETVEKTFTITGAPSIELSTTEVAQDYTAAVAVTVTGTNTHFNEAQPTITLVDGSGNTGTISGTSVTDKDTLSFNIGTGLTAGSYTLKIVTGAESVQTTFTVTAAATVTLSPAEVSQGYTDAFTITASGTNTHFKADTPTVTLVDGSGNSVGTISAVSASTNGSLTFSLGTGLSAGPYTAKIVTGVETVQTSFTVRDEPSISLTPADVAVGYTQAFTVTVAGTNTHFTNGQPSVSLLDGSGSAAATVSSVNATGDTALSFSIPTGLDAGTYTLKIVTGVETVQTSFTVTAAAAATPSPTTVTAGYSNTTISITGQRSHFSQGQTNVAVLDSTSTDTGKATSVTVTDAGTLSFTLASGLSADTYTVRITTGGERIDATLTVSADATISISPSTLASGYTATSINVTGSGTSFLTNASVKVLNSSDVEQSGYVLTTSASTNTALSFSLKAGLSAGTYTVKVSYGSPSTDKTATLTISADSTAPTLTFTSPTAGKWYAPGGSVTVSVDVTDDAAGISSSPTITATLGGTAVTGLSYTRTSDLVGKVTGTVTVPLDAAKGANDLVVQLADRSNNQGSATVSINVDTDGPTLTYSTPADRAWTKPGALVAVAMTAVDSDSGLPSSGTVTVTVGGTAATNTLAYTRTTGSTTSGSIAGTVTIPTGAASGDNDLVISLANAVGKAGTGTRTLQVDKTAPTLTFSSSPSGWYVVGGQIQNVSINVTDNESGLPASGAVTATLGGVSVTTHTLAFTRSTSSTGTIQGDVTVPSGVPAGANNLVVSFSDQAGNSGSGTQSVNIDSTGPSVSFTSPTAGTAYGPGQTVSVSATVTDLQSGLATNAVVTATLGGTSVSGLSFSRTDSTTGTVSGTITVPSGLTEGSHSLIVQISDQAGNQGTGSVSISVDATAPTLTYTAPTAGTPYKNGATITVSLNVSDNASGVANGATPTVTLGGQSVSAHTLSFSSSTNKVTGEVTVPSGLTAGANDLVVRMSDRAGIPGSATRSINIDNTAPTLSFTSTPTGWYRTGQQITVNITVTDNIALPASATVSTATIGGVAVSAQSLTYTRSTSTTGQIVGTVTVPTGVTPGARDLVVTLSDQAGIAGTGTQSVNVDGVAPALTFVTPDAGTYYKTGSTVTVEVSVDDGTGSGVANGATVTAALDGQNVTGLSYSSAAGKITGSVTVPAGLTDGANDLVVQVTDTAGNQGSATRSINIDNTAPTLTMDQPVADAAARPGGTVAVSVSVNDAGTGVANGATVTATVNGTAAANTLSYTAADGRISGNVTIPANQSDGTAILAVKISDQLGHEGSATQDLTITSVGPALTFVSPAAGARYKTGAQFNVEIDVTDTQSIADGTTVTATLGGQSLSGLTYTSSSGTSGQVTGTVTVPAGLTQGVNQLVVTLANILGNANADSPQVIYVDDLAPAFSFTSPTTATWYQPGATVPVSITVTDAAGGLPGSGATLTVTLAGDALTTHTLKFTRTDNHNGTIAGNVTLPDSGLTTGDVSLAVGLSDQVGNAGSQPQTVKVDAVAPVWPAAPTAADSTTSSVTVSWQAATDDVGIDHYEVYRGTTKFGESLSESTTTATVTGLNAGVGYTFTVKAYDAAGNVSTSLPLSASTKAQSTGGGGGSPGGGEVIVTPPTSTTDDQEEPPAEEPPAEETPKTPVDDGKGPGTVLEGNVPVSVNTEKQADGTVALTKTVDESQIDLTAIKDDLRIDLTAATAPAGSGEANQTAEVAKKAAEVPVGVLEKLAGTGKEVIIDAGVAKLDIPPAALIDLPEVKQAAARGAKASVKISVEAVDLAKVEARAAETGASTTIIAIRDSVTRAKDSGLKPAGKVLMLSAEVVTKGAGTSSTSTAVTNFSQKLTVRIPFDSATNPEHLGVYRLNRKTGQWEFRGGRVNVAGKFVSVELDGFSEYAVMEYNKTFADVPEGHWAKAGIEMMAARHVAKGTSVTQFSPQGDVTRAQFASLIVRALGLKPYDGFMGSFNDVKPGEWYFAEVETAAQAGLISGYQGTFRPNDRITRQEMAVIMGRVLDLRGHQSTLSGIQITALLGDYADRPQIAEWAGPAVARSVKLGLMKGRSATSYSPQANASRAEAVVVLQRLLKAIGDI